MKLKYVQRCTSFYDLKEKIIPKLAKSSYWKKNLIINEDNMSFTELLGGSFYKIECRKNEIIIENSYGFASQDDDVVTNANYLLRIKGNKIVDNYHTRVSKEYHSPKITDQFRGPMDEPEVTKMIEFVAKRIKEIEKSFQLSSKVDELFVFMPKTKATDAQSAVQLPEQKQPPSQSQTVSLLDEDEIPASATKKGILSAQADYKLIQKLLSAATENLPTDITGLAAEQMQEMNALMEKLEAVDNIKKCTTQLQTAFGLINTIDGLYKTEKKKTYQAGIGANINRQIEQLKEKIDQLKRSQLPASSLPVSVHVASSIFTGNAGKTDDSATSLNVVHAL